MSDPSTPSSEMLAAGGTNRRFAHEAQTTAAPAAVWAVWMDVIRRYPDLRKWVVLNKTVPVEVLETLSRDVDPGIRRRVAAKRKLTPELFASLATDKDENVRFEVASNRKVPLGILKMLVADESGFVASKACERLSQVS